MKRTWSKEQLAKLRERYPILPIDDLIKEIPFTKAQIKTAASTHKIVKKGRLYSWKYADELKLVELYSTTLNRELAVLFHKSESAIKGAAWKYKLLKTPEFMLQHALKSAFTKGHTPQNKGKKQVEYMSAEQIEKTAATRFKKGQKSNTELYDGCITQRVDKLGKTHKYLRVAKGKWLELQIHNWQQVNGPIPKGMCLASISGDTLDCDPGNWELITKQENMLRNSASTNLTDRYVANTIAWRDQDLQDALMEHPEIIDLKRKQLQLNRAIKQHGK